MTHDKPSIEWVVQRYGLAPNRQGFINCPVHEDRTPSCQLHDDWWLCFACGANGDSIGLIAALTKRPVADVLRDYTRKVPSWQNRRTVSLPNRANTLKRAYRELNAWFFRELGDRLGGAPDWMLLRSVEYWGDLFDETRRAVEDDPPRGQIMLRALAAQCERGLDVERKEWWEYAFGQLLLRTEHAL